MPKTLQDPLAAGTGATSATLRRLVLPLTCALATAYLAFHSGMGPNHVDGGLVLGYLQTMAEGGRPYFDFVDLYGLLSWPLPALFYGAAGAQVWGLRVWLLFIKAVAIALTAWGVERHAGRAYAVFAVVLLALLLGLPWQLLQTTYAFLPALALELCVLFLLLPGRPAPSGHASAPARETWLAAVLIGLTLLIKLNSGALLWAGAMFAAFYGHRRETETETEQARARTTHPWSRLWRPAQWLGLLAYFALFHLFIRTHYHGLYAVYLTVPLGLLLAWTARHLPAPAAMPANLRHWAVLALVPPLVALAGLALYLGADLGAYLRDTAALLTHLSYVAPIPALGQPGQYVGFNEFYWPQFTWLVSLVFCLWWWRVGRAASAVPPVFAIYVCTLFVMYSRTDESHLHQAMLLSPVMLALLLADLAAGEERLRTPLAVAAVGLAGFALATLGTLPMGQGLSTRGGDWASPRLRGLHYAAHPNPYVQPFVPGLDVARWDAGIDASATYIRRRVGEGRRVLVLGKNELLNYASHTRPGGGRYRYLFYLIKNHHLDRRGFLAIAPPGWLAAYAAEPPDAIVAVGGDSTLLATLPELAVLLRDQYVLDRTLGHIALYVRR